MASNFKTGGYFIKRQNTSQFIFYGCCVFKICSYSWSSLYNISFTLQVTENLGMVMIFTLVSAAQEWLNVKWEEIKLHRDNLMAQKLKDEEEAERVS